jgi:hypothetical protein
LETADVTSLMKLHIIVLILASLASAAFGQTRNVLVGTNNTVVQPTNFWSGDASNARAGLGLGTAATNPSTAFQPASSALTNLSTNNAGSLTNLSLSNTVGVLSIASGGTGATNEAEARTSLGLGSGSDVTFSNLEVFGTGSPTDLGIRLGGTNYGLWGSGGPPSVGVGINGTNRLVVTETQIIAGSPIAFNPTSGAATTRTNLGLGWAGTNAATTRDNLGLGATWLTNTNPPVYVDTNNNVVSGRAGALEFSNDIQIGGGPFLNGSGIFYIDANGGGLNLEEGKLIGGYGGLLLDWSESNNLTVNVPLSWDNTTNIATTRTNLGLPLAALTNTNTENFQGAIFPTSTTNAPTNTNAPTPDAWLDIRVGTNTYKLPLWQ